MDAGRMLVYFCLVVALFAIAPTTSLGQFAAAQESAKVSGEEKEAEDEPLLALAFDISGLPVWRIDEAGNRHFDASIVVSRIKSQVEANTWRSGTAKLIPSAKDTCLLVLAPVSEAHELMDKVSAQLQRMAAFAEHDAGVRLSENLERSNVANQLVLVFCSDPDSTLTDQFFAARSEHPGLQQVLRNNYLVQCVPSMKAKSLAEHGVVASSETGAALTIMDTDGKAIADKRFESLSDDGLAELVEFLEQHAKELPDAQQLLETALAQAKKEGKRVLVQMSGPACSPCILLSKYLSGHKDLVTKDYVYVKLDLRMPRSREVRNSIGPDFRGVPWMAILSEDGKLLINSQSPQGNIAFPRSDTQKEHFRKMLQSTSRRLSESDIDALVAALPASSRVSPPRTSNERPK